jgi:hypothetical protein
MKLVVAVWKCARTPKNPVKTSQITITSKLHTVLFLNYKSNGKGLPQQAEVAQGVPGRLRPRIFLTFVTTRVVGRQPYASAAFTPGEIPGTHF